MLLFEAWKGRCVEMVDAGYAGPSVVGKVGLGRSQAFSKSRVYRGSNSVQRRKDAKPGQDDGAVLHIYICHKAYGKQLKTLYSVVIGRWDGPNIVAHRL